MSYRRPSRSHTASHNRSSSRNSRNSRNQNRRGTISDNAREKEAALLETLQDAEMRQLESFIKKRSLQLDDDIQKLQEQLHSKTTVKSIENEELAKKVLGPELGVQGVGLANADMGVDYANHEATQVQSSPKRDYDFDAAKARATTKPKISDHHITFLARIKLKMEDVNMSPMELKELMLPSDLTVPGERYLPISEVTGVLQTDLLMPVTKNDQVMLLKHYGNSDGEVDIPTLLEDAGVWYDGPVGSAGSPEKTYYEKSGGKEGGYGDPLHQQRGSINRKQPMSSINESLLDDLHDDRKQHDERNHTKEETPHNKSMSLSARNLNELDDLHQRLLQEKEYDFDETLTHKQAKPLGNYGDDDVDDVKSLTDQSHRRDVNDDDITPIEGLGDDGYDFDDNKPKSSPREPPLPPTEKPSGELELSRAARDRMSALAHENQRLKSELSNFDAGFFEELEDLKFRYSRLQEVVGEDPYLTSTRDTVATDGIASNGYRKQRHGGSGLPLDRLSWSVRNSMTAMDRAGLTSPLVARPRYAHAYTYSPGGVAIDSHEGTSHPGGAVHNSSLRQEEKPSQQKFDDDKLAGSGSYPPPLFHRSGEYDRSRDYDGRMGTWHNLFGGEHAVGAGTHAVVPQYRDHNSISNIGESFSNLCERRLAFELSQHPSPETATRSLIHRVMDIAHRDENKGFISVADLGKVFSLVKINMSPKELELLATGFASDAHGGIDAQEFCEAVKTLLYNLLGEHAAQAAEEQAWVNGNNMSQQAKEQLHKLLKEMCEGILAHDKRAVLGSSPNVFKTLLKPFIERDRGGKGSIDFSIFWEVLKEIGVLLTYQDVMAVARHYALPAGIEKAPSSYPSSNLTHIKAFRDAQLRGSLSGAAKANPSFGDWLAHAGIGVEDAFGNSRGNDGSSREIEYTPFVTDLTEHLIRLMEQNGGVQMGTKFPWILREFEFVDTLIVQLEEMKPSQRRKVLMSLQYALAAADPKHECELDGFTVLNSLLNAGFRLQRVNRVRLLRAVEELGGKMDYRDLCQVLLNSCADWTSEEKRVVKKVLKAMGVTVIERRSWLAKLRQYLMEAGARVARKTGRWFASERNGSGSSAADPVEENDITAVPPSAFLHCLRECGVVLNVEEEATLLDCLDTERLSKQQGQLEAQYGHAARAVVVGKENWSIPMIHYEAFLQFCARHCGSWTDAAPEMNEELKKAVQMIANSTLGVHELASLLQAFDEVSSGFVSKRAFQICCHRSRLLTSLSDDVITQLSEILTMDGGGRVDYIKFIVHLRALSASFGAENAGPGIIDQLVHNATDKRGSLLPLRNWLMRNTDMETFLLNSRDLNALLREFSVVYRPEDLEQLQMDVGRHVDAQSMLTKQAMRDMVDEDMRTALSADSSGGLPASMKKHVVDSRDLLMKVLKERPHWTTLHPYLCKRMLKSMKLTGMELFNNPSGSSKLAASSTLMHMMSISDETSYQDTDDFVGKSKRHQKLLQGPRGIETAVARRVLSRLRAFAGRGESAIGAIDNETRIRDANQLMVERDIFKHIAGVTGLPLSDEDVLILADASDFMPEASRVRCDVILEALLGEDPEEHLHHHTVNGALGNEGHRNRSNTEKRELSEAGLFALDHLRSLLWSQGSRLNRTVLEWEADVRAVFSGFDPRRTGFISSEDFIIALELLNSSVSPELLLDISYFPEGPGLIDYRDILDFVLRVPTQEDKAAAALVADDLKHKVKETKPAPHPKAKQKTASKESPVQSLLLVIRKALHQFIVSDHSLEAAWVCMLKVFKRFDPQETNFVSPRDFCLAVSVLLEGDEIVLTKSEWAEIIDFFAQSDDDAVDNKSKRHSRTDFLGGAMVDYMLFCEAVLDPNEIKMRLYTKRGEKENKPKNHHDSSASLTVRHCHACSPPKRNRNEKSKEPFKDGISGSRINRTSRPTSRNNATISKRTERKLLIDDPINVDDKIESPSRTTGRTDLFGRQRRTSQIDRITERYSSRGSSPPRMTTDLYGRPRTTGQDKRILANFRDDADTRGVTSAIHGEDKKWWGSLAAKRSLSPPRDFRGNRTTGRFA